MATDGGSHRLLISLLTKVFGPLFRYFFPSTSYVDLQIFAQELRQSSSEREEASLDQLRAGPGSLLDKDFQSTSRFLSGATRELQVLSNIGPYYQQLGRSARVVITGEPGAGKTVFAISLIIDRLKHDASAGDAAAFQSPVPIRVNAAGWDGVSDFSEWLANRISADFNQRPRVARALVAGGWILPVLDGLDEMGASDVVAERATCAIAHLNRSPWRRRPVVVVCRADLYARIQNHSPESALNGAVVLTLPPLTVAEIGLHLFSCREELGIPADYWAPMTEQIMEQPDGPVAIALQTPWLLGLAVNTLRNSEAALERATKLANCESPGAVRDYLLEAQIPAALSAAPPGGTASTYTEEQVRAWLGTVAAHFDRNVANNLGGNDIRLDEVWMLAGQLRCRILYGIAAGLIAAAGIALLIRPLVMLSLLPLNSTDSGVVFVPALSLTFLAAFIALTVATSRSSSTAERFAWRVPGVSRWRRGLLPATGVGILVGVAAGMTSTGFPNKIIPGVFVGGVAAILTASLLALRTTSKDRLRLGQQPDQLIRDDRNFAVGAGLAMGLAIMIPLAAVAWFVFGRLFGGHQWVKFVPLLTLPGGFAVSLVAALVLGHTYGRYAVACLLFRINETFPSRPRIFFEWARSTGLLRVTGLSYQFRHEEFRWWIATKNSVRS